MSNKNESNMSLESAVLVNALGNQSTDSLAASIGTQSSASFGDTSGGKCPPSLLVLLVLFGNKYATPCQVIAG